MRQPPRPAPRAAAAAVEFAVVLPLIFLLLLGTWEVARLVQVHAILCNAVREGARLAAQGQVINLTGAYTQIVVADADPNSGRYDCRDQLRPQRRPELPRRHGHQH